MLTANCVFCKIASGETEAYRVYEDDEIIVFLDASPLFAGHSLVCPKQHHDTLMDVDPALLQRLFTTTQLIARAVERGLGAEGSLIAVNNRISQSVPHLHVHVIPRRRGDGLKGFFWPRRPYRDREHALETQRMLEAAVTYLLSDD
jgi:histidine triad (HIT) family protein